MGASGCRKKRTRMPSCSQRACVFSKVCMRMEVLSHSFILGAHQPDRQPTSYRLIHHPIHIAIPRFMYSPLPFSTPASQPASHLFVSQLQAIYSGILRSLHPSATYQLMRLYIYLFIYSSILPVIHSSIHPANCSARQPDIFNSYIHIFINHTSLTQPDS